MSLATVPQASALKAEAAARAVDAVKVYGRGETEVRALDGVAYPNAELQSRAEYIDAQAAQIDMIVNLMYGLLGLAVIIALISIANSMALSIHERTR